MLLPGCVALARSPARWTWWLFIAGVAVLGFEAVVIGLQETAGTHDMSTGRWIGLMLVLLTMLATYAGQVLVAAWVTGGQSPDWGRDAQSRGAVWSLAAVGRGPSPWS